MTSSFPLERSPEARRLAEIALGRLALEHRDDEVPFVVLGGLVPEATIKFEFLCELDDHPEGVAEIPGCERLRLSNLRGTGYVSEDWQWVDLQLASDRDHDVLSVRFAGLEGFVMSKAHVAWRRGAAKDYYDLVYVLIYSPAGDPADVADVLAAGRFGERIDLTAGPWPELRARFQSAHDIGAASYSEQAVQADPSLDPAVARQDATGAVMAFLDRLGERLAPESIGCSYSPMV